jgi:hypothetical protein
MMLLGIMFDGHFFRGWRLFSWCVYFPVLTIVISWVLIHWKRSLVAIPLGIAALSACALLIELHGDIRFRTEHRSNVERFLKEEIARTPDVEPEHKAEHEKLLDSGRHELQFFNSQMYGGIPHYNQRTITAVWFAALFPFVMIIAFYLATSQPAKAQDSSPTPPSHSS